MAAAEVTNKGSKGAWVGVVAILIVAWLFMLIGVLGIYMYRTLYNQDVFAKRVTAVITQPDTQAALATGLTNAVIKEVPKAIIARPIIQSAAETVVAEPAFTTIVTTALVKLHAALLNPETANLVFTVEGAPQLIENAIAPYDATIAKQVGAAASAEMAKLPDLGAAFRLIQLGADLGPVSWVIALLGLGLAILAAFIAPTRRKGAVAAAITLLLVGIGLLLIYNLLGWGLNVATAGKPVESQLLSGVVQGLFGDMRTIGRVIAIVGVVIAVVIWSLRYTMPAAQSAIDKAKESDALAGARDAAGNVIEGAKDASGKALGSASATSGTAIATVGSRKIEVTDLTDVAKSAVSKALYPAASTGGKILQGIVLLALAALVLLEWALIVDIIVLIIAVALFALALNRILLVVLDHRAKNAVGEGEEQATVGSGASSGD